MTTTLQVCRHQDLIAQLAKENERRDAWIVKLGRSDAKLRTLRKAIVRSSKRLDAMRVNAPLPQPPKPAAIVTDIPVTELPIADDLAIPTFLQRKQEGVRKDKEAADKLLAEQAEHKTAKARGRIEKMKAKASGEMKKMPLVGKAALEAIRAAG